MVTQIENIIYFTNELLKGNKYYFKAKLIGRFIRIIPFANLKVVIHEHLNVQHHFVLDRENPIKVVIRGLLRSMDIDLI